MTWTLKRTRQCAECPWKTDVEPQEIPGYSLKKHQHLLRTIAGPVDKQIGALGQPLHVMACHMHPEGGEAHCLGWLMNQVGPGNNIAMRIALMECANRDLIELVGEQRERFEDTLPQEVKEDV